MSQAKFDVRVGKAAQVLLAAAVLAGCMTRPAPMPRHVPAQPSPPLPPVAAPLPPMAPVALPLQLSRAGFADLKEWAESDPRAGFSAFQRSCVQLMQKPDDALLGGVQYGGTIAEWRGVCGDAAAASPSTSEAARRFFETEFAPYRVAEGSAPGLFTGYYELELKGSRTRHGVFQTPLYGVPADLVSVDLGLFRDTFKGQRLAGRVTNGRLVPYPARAEIVARGLSAARALFYVDDPLDAFFLQIQGSGRVVLDDGSIVRAAFAAQNGQPYTAIGAVLVQRGELRREEVSLQSIRAWIKTHPAEAEGLMNANASYVFFQEKPIGDPILGAAGTEGVALTPEASIAVDTTVHALGLPVWLETTAPDADENAPERSFNRLLVMQDTGGAIHGAIRGDVYWGYGAAAGSIAGRMRSEGRLTVLLPKAVAQRLGPSAGFSVPR